MKTIVVGAVYRYTWSQIDLWWRSLVLTGFDGEVHLLTYECSPLTIKSMLDVGIIVHPCPVDTGQVVIDRFNDLSILCLKFNPTDWVIFADVGDIVFQSNPEHFLEDSFDSPFKLIVASEGILFEGNSWTDNNLKVSIPEEYETMRNCLVYNAGSFAGTANLIIYLATRIYEESVRRLPAQKHDQAVFNVLLRGDEYIQGHTLFTGAMDGWCHCAASSIFCSKENQAAYLEKLPVIRNGKCYVGDGTKLVCLFHHYTRDRETTRKVKKWVDRAWKEQGFTYFQFTDIRV